MAFAIRIRTGRYGLGIKFARKRGLSKENFSEWKIFIWAQALPDQRVSTPGWATGTVQRAMPLGFHFLKTEINMGNQ
jgi:hypothetical protein